MGSKILLGRLGFIEDFYWKIFWCIWFGLNLLKKEWIFFRRDIDFEKIHLAFFLIISKKFSNKNRQLDPIRPKNPFRFVRMTDLSNITNTDKFIKKIK